MRAHTGPSFISENLFIFINDIRVSADSLQINEAKNIYSVKIFSPVYFTLKWVYYRLMKNRAIKLVVELIANKRVAIASLLFDYFPPSTHIINRTLHNNTGLAAREFLMHYLHFGSGSTFDKQWVWRNSPRCY